MTRSSPGAARTSIPSIEPQALSAAPPSARRRRRSKAERRRIVEETLVPGASVARVARAHDVNANQVFYWRHLYKKGLLGDANASTSALIPVRIADLVDAGEQKFPASVPLPPKLTPASSRRGPRGIIHVETARARLRLEGSADPATLRTLLECLLA